MMEHENIYILISKFTVYTYIIYMYMCVHCRICTRTTSSWNRVLNRTTRRPWLCSAIWKSPNLPSRKSDNSWLNHNIHREKVRQLIIITIIVHNYPVFAKLCWSLNYLKDFRCHPYNCLYFLTQRRNFEKFSLCSISTWERRGRCLTCKTASVCCRRKVWLFWRNWWRETEWVHTVSHCMHFYLHMYMYMYVCSVDWSIYCVRS